MRLPLSYDDANNAERSRSPRPVPLLRFSLPSFLTVRLPCAPVEKPSTFLLPAELRCVSGARRIHVFTHASGGRVVRADRGSYFGSVGTTVVRPSHC